VKIDKDGSGQLDKQEVHDALELTSSSESAESINAFSDWIDQQFAQADVDLSGKIGLDEFTGIYKSFVLMKSTGIK